MTHLVRSVPLVLALLIAIAVAARGAQSDRTSELRGRVVDPAGEPVAGLTVVLHRVTGEGGAEIARAESGPDGRFAIPVAVDDAVYFAAVRYGNGLHVGVPFRGSPPEDADYLIVVGADETAILLGAPGEAPDPRTRGAVAWLVVPAAAIGFMFVRRRRGRNDPLVARRAALLELAELEERRSRAAVSEAEYEAARAALHERLGAPLPTS